MNASEVKQGARYRVPAFRYLNRPACSVVIVSRRTPDTFIVEYPNQQRETVHCSDLSRISLARGSALDVGPL